MDMHFEGVIFQSHAAELRRRMRHPYPPFAILDVRSPEDYSRGHIPGALHATVDSLAGGLPTGTSPRTEFFLVGSGPDDERVRAASLALRRAGARRRVEVPGGLLEWRRMGYPVEEGGGASRPAA